MPTQQMVEPQVPATLEVTEWKDGSAFLTVH